MGAADLWPPRPPASTGCRVPRAGCALPLAEGRAHWAIPWPCLHEFLALVTHRRIFNPPSTIEQALDQIDIWLESPSLVLLGEAPDHLVWLHGLVQGGRVVGPAVHDARIAAICQAHGVPGAGDTITGVGSIALLLLALNHPQEHDRRNPLILNIMVGTIVVDTIVGVVPFAGDVRGKERAMPESAWVIDAE